MPSGKRVCKLLNRKSLIEVVKKGCFGNEEVAGYRESARLDPARIIRVL